MSLPRVLVLHNRYRLRGGEERAVELHLAALTSAGIEHSLLERESGEAGSLRAGRALLRGGEDPEEIADAVRDFRADVVHCHNMLPLFGPKGLAAAKRAGARVVLHLHNYRLFCNVYAGFRDGDVCFRCRGRRTLPGVVLNCRGSLPESAAYSTALGLHQPEVFRAVDRFVAPSEAARGRLASLGVPADRLSVVPHYVPEADLAASSTAESGEFVLAAGRLTPEKGFDVAIEASRQAGVPLRIAGGGPAFESLREQASGAPVEVLGPLPGAELAELRATAAAAIVPSLWEETFGLVALEAMAAGLPVAASAIGALPEVAGRASCVPPGDVSALARRLEQLWGDAALRREEGVAALARARKFSEQRFLETLLPLYVSLRGQSPQ